ncbi:MAG TPA: adenylate/guanylate cyclase domain-containing protein [Desulfobacterales bacterium]|nr:adenylate/guanylate cyclase domain-containing protein [Desulfobacterales bacterium]
MNIRAKIVLVVLPLVIAPLVLTGVSSVLTARESVTAVAAGLLQFKAEQLTTYARGQWDLLVANGLDGDARYREASEAAVETFARSLLRSPTELIVALGPGGAVALRTDEISEGEPGLAALAAATSGGASGWQALRLGDVDRVGYAIAFDPFGWTVFVTEASAAFYRPTERIVTQTGIILGASLVAALLLLFFFAGFLTRPLRQIADAMQGIITTGDLSQRVETLYRDETGRLGHTFNLMTGDLERAYGMVKGYALRAAVAKENEEKIRHIFQKYVPKAVIDQFYASPEKMLVGEMRPVAVLFSDIRSFTTIVETFNPGELVEMLNAYFGCMAKVIYARHGIVDKYIGDAIMAVFGAPEKQENDALAAVLTALEMLDALVVFNESQRKLGRPPLKSGIGLHYGPVIVGNIGSEFKMDYTVMGDRVNLASRLEGLTKQYHEPLVVSDSIQRRVRAEFPTRLLDRVSVKGRKESTGLYTLRRTLQGAETEAWTAHNDAAARYYERRFDEAAAGFQKVLALLPKDEHARRFLEKCAQYRAAPPGEGWTGVEEMTEK